MKAVIIGGGIIGLSLADELTRRGIRVTLLEKSSETGREASGAAAGILAPQSEAQGPGPFLDLLLAGAQMIPEAVARLEALTGIHLEYRVSGMLTVSFSDVEQEQLARAFQWQAAAGLSPQRVDAARVRQMEPAVDGNVRGGIYWAQSAQLDPRKFVAATERAVRAAGADIRLGEQVTRVLMKGRRAAGVETSAGILESDWVIHCGGPWAAEENGLPFSIPLVPARGQILQFAPPQALFRRVVKSPRAYVVQRSDHCLIAGTTLEYVGFDNGVTEEGRRAILEGVREISLQAGSLDVQSSWAGLRPDTPDHLPILGPTPLEGFLVAAGHFRNGILLAPLTGRLIADSILGVRSSVDLAPFSHSRFMVG